MGMVYKVTFYHIIKIFLILQIGLEFVQKILKKKDFVMREKNILLTIFLINFRALIIQNKVR
jgi:hypothetical protein